ARERRVPGAVSAVGHDAPVVGIAETFDPRRRRQIKLLEDVLDRSRHQLPDLAVLDQASRIRLLRRQPAVESVPARIEPERVLPALERPVAEGLETLELSAHLV